MLEIVDEGYLAEVRAYADGLGPEIRKQLEEKLSYLEHYRSDECICVLSKDFAPYSFYFTMLHPTKEDPRKYWFNGGLIHHAPRSTGAGFPELSVTLVVKDHPHWEIHT